MTKDESTGTWGARCAFKSVGAKMTKQQRRMILRDAESIASGQTEYIMQTFRSKNRFWPLWFLKLFFKVFPKVSFDSREHRVLCLLLLLEVTK